MAGISGISGFGSEQLLSLLVAQLQNQDPLDPVSNKDLTAQVTSLNTLSGIQSLDANFASMLKLQQLTQGSNLVGKTIEYTAPDGSSTSTGTVDSVAVRDGSFVLAVGTDQVELDQIKTVR